MHTLRIPLDVHGCEREIERRFNAINHIHNVCVSYMQKQMGKLGRDREYQAMLDFYVAAKTEAERITMLEKPSKLERHALRDLKNITKVLSADLTARRNSLNLSKTALESYIKVCGKQFKNLVSSQQVQAEADRVWRGVEKCLFGKGHTIHYQKRRDLASISGKSNVNGAKFDVSSMTVEWNGLTLSCIVRKKRAAYVAASLNGKVSYCEITRKMFSSGWRYYANLYIQGDTVSGNRKAGHGDMGIDPGVSTIAATGESELFLEELAPRVPEYNKQILELQYRMEASRRDMNPGKYNPNGTINRKNKDRWIFSKGYQRLWQKLRTVCRKKAAYIRQSHEELTNRLLAAASVITIEHMEYKALQKRAKNTERRETSSTVKQKDGSTKTVFKFKKKKRFGRSLNNRAPAECITILKRKAAMLGVTVDDANAATYKASQYDHTTGECEKISLNARFKEIDGHRVQRDLYSSFLFQNPEKDLKHPDRQKCKARFENFLKLHDELIARMQSEGKSMRQCFGF